MHEHKAGDWVLYKGEHFACIHSIAHQAPYRALIEWITEEKNGKYINRDWVHRSTLTPLDGAVIDLMRSIYNIV